MYNNIFVGNRVRIIKEGELKNQEGIVLSIDNEGSGNESYSIQTSANIVTVNAIDTIPITTESFNKELYDIISTYNRSISGDVCYLLQSKTSGNLYVQLINLSTYETKGPYFVGAGRNNPSAPNEEDEDEETYDLNNTTFRFEDRERNPNLERGMLMIIGQSNNEDKDTYRYVCHRIGGPWQRERIIREVG